MNINTLAKLTLFGLAYIYTAKLIDTLFHGIFRPAALAAPVVGLNILAGLVQLIFFITLYPQAINRDCCDKNHQSGAQKHWDTQIMHGPGGVNPTF